MCTLDPGTCRILPAELLGLLPPPGRPQRLVLLARQQPDDPRLLLRSRASGPDRARRTILPREPSLEGHAALRIGIGQPRDALLSRRAGYDLLLPVHREAPLVEALAGTGLPTRVLGHRADDGHTVLLLAVDQYLGIRVPLVDQMLTRKQVALFLRLMHHLDYVVVRCRRRCGLDVDDQIRTVRITRLGEVHLVSDPVRLALDAIPRL